MGVRRSVGREGWEAPLVVALCLALAKLAGRMVTADIYAAAAPWCPLAAEVPTLLGSLAYLIVFIIACFWPSLLDRRLLAAVLLCSMATAGLSLMVALPLQVPWVALAGLSFQSLVASLLFVMVVCALPALGCGVRPLSSIAVGLAVGEMLADLFPSLPALAALILIDGLTVLMLGLLYRLIGPTFACIARNDAPTVLEITNPESFVAPTSGLYVAAVIFHVATGFGITFGEVSHAPADYGTVAFVLGAATLWLLLSRSNDKEDTLFSFSVLTVMAAYLVAPFTFASGNVTANALMSVGTWCFNMLMWLVAAAVGCRNLLTLVPTFALLRCVGSVGTTIGAVVGRAVNDLVPVNGEMASLVTAGALFLFVALLWTGFRFFSFSAVIRDVAPLGEESGSSVAAADGDLSAMVDSLWGGTAQGLADADGGSAPPVLPTLEERCEAIGREYGLTRRETEIFAMLARGRNGRFLMDHYVVSRNTVKSHIKHIYAKLGVHSQQELIDLVEGAAAEPSRPFPAQRP